MDLGADAAVIASLELEVAELERAGRVGLGEAEADT